MDSVNSSLKNAQTQIAMQAEFAKNFKPSADAESTKTNGANGGGVPDLNSTMSQMLMMLVTLIQQLQNKNPDSPVDGSKPGPIDPGYNFIPGVNGNNTKLPQTPAEIYLQDKLNAKTGTWSQSDIQALIKDMEAKNFKPHDLAQTFKQAFLQSDPTQMAVIGPLTTALIQDGKLNGSALLQDSYLGLLNDAQTKNVVDSVTNAGLTLKDGSSNQKLVGFLIAHNNIGGEPNTSAVINQLLQAYSNKIDPQSSSFPILQSIILILGGATPPGAVPQ